MNTAPRLRVLRLSDLMLEDRGWTRGHATCAFDDVPKHAPGYLEFGPLRLCALQEIDPGAGYPMHPHEEIETITIVLAGAMAHEDSLGERSITGCEDVAVLSAGTGMEHAEMVHGDAKARALLFWLRSETRGQPPCFTTRSFDRRARAGRMVTLACGGGTDGALVIRASARIASAILDPGASVEHAITGRGYVVPVDGAIEVNGVVANAGERILVESPGTLAISARARTEVVVLDMAA